MWGLPGLKCIFCANFISPFPLKVYTGTLKNNSTSVLFSYMVWYFPPQMQKIEAPKLTNPTPSLPPHLPYHFDVLQSSHELLQHFKLFCDWAYRAFLSLKPKASAVQWWSKQQAAAEPAEFILIQTANRAMSVYNKAQISAVCVCVCDEKW